MALHVLKIENRLVLSPETAQYVKGIHMSINSIRLKFSQKYLVANVIHSYDSRVSIPHQPLLFMTKKLDRLYDSGLKHAARGPPEVLVRPETSFINWKFVIILANFYHFLTYSFISQSISVQTKSFLKKFSISLFFRLHNAARRAVFILICGPRRHFPSQCGPCIVLSLRPLLYDSTHAINNLHSVVAFLIKLEKGTVIIEHRICIRPSFGS
jgi:hypothetical protein